MSYQDPYATPPQAPTTQRRPNTLVIALLAFFVGGILVAGAILAPKVIATLDGRTFEISGDLTITGSGIKYGAHAAACVGDGGYDDIDGRTSVVITNAKGETVAVGSLAGEGKARRDSISPIKPTSCTFTFKVTGVPEGSDFYGVTIGKRGTQQYPRAKLSEPIHLTLS